MPLSSFQKEVLALLASNRNPESYVAGAAIVNMTPQSPRFSRDIDIFHDPQTSVAISSQADINVLRAHGLQVELLLQRPSFVRASVKNALEGVKLEWAIDTAFRFFPVVRDPVFGYRLHEIDAAINKSLALAGRTEIRDVIDMLTIHDTLLHLGACCWAACGKDPGFTPDLILELISRNARMSPDLLAQQILAEPIDPKKIKLRWIAALRDAHDLIQKMNPEELGCLYINSKGEVSHTPQPKDKPHFGSVRGCWPVMVD